VAPPGPAADTCAVCAGEPVTHACGDCGIEDKLYEKGRCSRCSLRRRARELLSSGTSRIPSELAEVFEAITAGGALPPRDEELARTEQWLTALLASIHIPEQRRLVQSFATWQVLRRLRRSAAPSTRPRSPTAHARNQIKAAASFLTWLASRGQPLASCRCADVDDWLATGPGAWQVRGFLTWAARRGHCPPFAIPGPGRAHGTATSPDQRWALAARLLHDGSLDPTDRVAGTPRSAQLASTPTPRTR
jgi:hypothetical protein